MRKSVNVCGNGFLAHTLNRFAELFENELYNDRYSRNGKMLQNLDPRIKVIVVLAFILYGNFTTSLAILLALGIVAALYATASGLPLGSYLRRTWLYLPSLLFLCSLPGASSLLTRGTPLIGNETFYFTAAGLQMACRIGLRTGDSLAFAFLLLTTTRWTDLMAGLRALHLPALFISVLNMAYRYIFLIAETGSSMMQARYLRTVGRVSARSGRRYMGNSFGRIFVSVHSFSENIYDAMVLRGYDGTPRTMRRLKIQAADWLFLLINIIILMILTVGGFIFG